MGECWACCEEVRGGGGRGKVEEEGEEENEGEEDKSTGPMFSKDVVNLESSSSVLFVFIALKKLKIKNLKNKKKKKKQGKKTTPPNQSLARYPLGRGGKEREGIRQGQNREN